MSKGHGASVPMVIVNRLWRFWPVGTSIGPKAPENNSVSTLWPISERNNCLSSYRGRANEIALLLQKIAPLLKHRDAADKTSA